MALPLSHMRKLKFQKMNVSLKLRANECRSDRELFSGRVLVSCAAVIEAPQTGGLKTKETYYLTVFWGQGCRSSLSSGSLMKSQSRWWPGLLALLELRDPLPRFKFIHMTVSWCLQLWIELCGSPHESFSQGFLSSGLLPL